MEACTDRTKEIARPSRSHLPSPHQPNVFCHACLTNQTLIMNLLANYLPHDDVGAMCPCTIKQS